MSILNRRYATCIQIILFLSMMNINSALGQKKTEKITFGTLLEELTNRENLSIHPSGHWTQHQASSYDRLSITPNDPKGWYANQDWNNFIRTEKINGRAESVMLDVDGPGVITRFWNAGDPNFKAALRFYIDGDTIPVWEADHSGSLIGENKLIGPPLSSRTVEKDQLPINEGARPGHNLYAPIPFSKHIKITYEGPTNRPGPGQGIFYNINYRLYEGNVVVESLSKSTASIYAEILKRTNEKLAGFMAVTPKEATVPGERDKKTKDFILNKGETGAVSIKGEASIRRLLLSIKAEEMNKAVKDLWIRLSFDGKITTDVPVGFFFGCGDQLVSSSDWYRKVDTEGNMACFWVMPFQRKVEVKIVNKGSQIVSATLEVATGKSHWSENSIYFHCIYAQLKGFETEAEIGQDFNYITIASPGVYVGDILQVSKKIGGWWGEGDEKIYIDGSVFPDHFGTGAEDYYGYAWGHPETFSHPFIGQPIGNANLIHVGGTTVNSRLRGLDAIPFSKSLRFDMEQWNWHGGKIDLTWACFWYGQLEDKSYVRTMIKSKM